MFDSGSEKRLVLEVDHDQRWYRVTEHRLVRSRSFFRGGMDSPARSSTFASSPRLSGLRRSGSGVDPGDNGIRAGRTSSDSMQEADTSYFADDASCCSASSFSSSSSDQESTCSIPFEKINLTWSPPPKGSSKRGSKRFSSVNPLRDMALTPSAAGSAVSTPPLDFASVPPNESSSVAGSGPKSYEHLPALDGCIHLDLGRDISPSTLLFPLRRATLGIDPENMDEHLESLISCPSAVTSELAAVVSFPDMELRPVRTHVAYVGQGSCPSQSVVELWTDEDDDEAESTLVEVDGDGLVIQYGVEWARLNVC
ncbi:hypothetical protein EC968_003087 [Mortierella alpina]|nr:hypothetical protein EC968_003087 [Mortierella alpina]